jgi:hypothetical protein
LNGIGRRSAATVAAISLIAAPALAVPAVASVTGSGTTHAQARPEHTKHSPAGTSALRRYATFTDGQWVRRGQHPAPVRSGPIAPDTTETSVTAANPDGTFTNTISALPARVRQHGAWVPVSARLVRTRGGWSPVAATEPLLLSPGGDGPAAELAPAPGKRLSLWFPGRLPAPVISGASATYRSVRPGIDLRLTATTLGGVRETLIVRSPSAAASSWLSGFALRYQASGLRLVPGAGGSVIAVSSHGAGPRAAIMSAGPPVVTGPKPGRATLPARGATSPDRPTAPGRAVLAGDEIAERFGAGSGLSLLGARSAYPVSITTTLIPGGYSAGPAAASRRGRGNSPGDSFPSPYQAPKPGYDEAQDVQGSGGCQGAMNWDGKNSVTQLGIGFQAWDSCQGVYQSYYVFDTSGISNNWDILHIELNLTEVEASWDACSAANEPVYLHSLGTNAGIGSGTDGSNVSTLGTTSGSNKVMVAPAQNPNSGSTCPNQPADFDVTQYSNGMQGDANWTFGVSGDDDDNPSGGQFMRLSDNPTLVTTFDETPPAPAMEQSDPVEMDNPSTPDTNYGCETSGNSTPTIPWIGATPSVQVNADFTAALTGEQVQPGWLIVNQSSAVVDKTESNTSNYQQNQSFSNPVDGDEYFILLSTTVNGNGQSYDSGLTSAGTACSFAADETPPAVPTVASSAFPASGSGQTSAQTAPGGSGDFTFSSSDPPPSGCSSSNPIASAGYGGSVEGCLASGVYEFEYSLNTPLPSGSVLTPGASCPVGGEVCGAVSARNSTGNPATNPSANPSANTTGTSPSIGISQWGTNVLYVAAVDAAGNVSQSVQYDFYVPWNPQTKVSPGDVNGDGTPDLLATTSTGNLVLYPGGSDPALGPSIASLSQDTPEPGTPWNDYEITHRGSWSAGTVDDLFALDTGDGDLFRYISSDTTTGMFENTSNARGIFYPASCSSTPDNSANCSGYPTAGWSAFNQILAPGDAWTGAPSGSGVTNDTSFPSLLAVDSSTGSLWLFQGISGQLQNPVQLGSSGWNDVTLMAPGIVDGSNTIWARINSGTDAGDVFSFELTVPSGDPPTLDQAAPGTPVSPTSGAMLTSGGTAISVPAATYPTIASTGALTGGTCSSGDPTACPGFYAEDTTGGLWYYPGQPTTTQAGALTGNNQLVGGVDHARFAWALSDGSGNTASDSTGGGRNGTLTGGVSWVTDPARGTVASFDGSTGYIDASGGILLTRGGQSFSVSAWVYPEQDGYRDAVSQDGTEVSAFHLDITAGGYWGFRRPLTDDSDPVYTQAVSSTPAELSTWTFLTATFDGSTDQMDLYVNGQLAATATDPTPVSTVGPTAVGRGLYDAGATDFWNGKISSVEGFQYALTPAEVQTLYAGNGQTLLTQLS